MNMISSVASFGKEHAPELMVTSGAIGLIVTAVFAVKEKSKADLVLEKHNEELAKYKAVLEDEDIAEEDYTQSDYNNDVIHLYCKTGIELVGSYKWAIASGAISLGLILGGFGIIKHRYVGAIAACGAFEDALYTYRERVREKYGDDADAELLYSPSEEVEETIETDEDGNEKTVTTVKPKTNPLINTVRISLVNPIMIKYPNSYKVNRLATVKAFQNIVSRNIEEDLFNRSKVSGATVAITANEIISKLGYPQQVINEKIAAGVELDPGKIYGLSEAGNIVGWTYNFNSDAHKSSLAKELGIDNSSIQWNGVKDFINGSKDFFYLTIPCEDIASLYEE